MPTIPGPFHLKRQIASGASSTVFAATNTTNHSTVALKVFHSQLVQDPAFAKRLMQESDVLQKLCHPNIVRLIQTWSLESKFFLELELVNGATLKTWAENNSTQWLEPHLWILAQVARAIGAVHEQQLLHRDLKPENILISSDGVVKLTDFGLARSEVSQQRLTQTGSVVGSLSYMAPETIDGHSASFASDIFSFGTVAYELLCKHHPFADTRGQLQIGNLLAGQFTPVASCNPRVPRQIAKLIASCLSRDSSARPPSIWKVEAELMDYLHRSGQLSLLKDWFKSNAPNLEATSLQLKNEKLKSEILQSIAEKKDRSHLLPMINEFHALFPNDPAGTEMMSVLTTTQENKKKRPLWILTLTTVSIFVGTIWLWQLPPKAISDTKQSTPIPAAIKEPNPPPIQAHAPTKRVAKPVNAPQPQYGQLRLLVDPGVRAFVDGRRVADSEMAKYKIASGRHQLRLEKDGFLPIERTVLVRPSRTTMVNAKTEEPQ